MMFGLSDETIQNIREACARVPAINRVVLYGSRAKGNYRAGSDIDLVLMGDGLSLQNSVYPLMEMLEELDLPYSFDISIFQHIENLALVEHINRVGIVFYERI
jgi:uncharacterized protein